MRDICINFDIAKSKAISIKNTGFGLTPAVKNYNLHILRYIDIEELTQLVAIAFYRSKKESKNFYSMLSKEIAHMGLYKNKRKETIDFDTTDLKEDKQVKQLYNLYSAIGFDMFYKYLNISVPRSTVQKWTWKCFGKRKNESRLSVNKKRELKRILETGGQIRFSKTSSSVYIFNNEIEIRISDHSEDAKIDFEKIQISYANRN